MKQWGKFPGVWHKTNTSFQKRNINPLVKYSGGSIMVWVGFVEYPERERPAMNQAQLHQQGHAPGRSK